uniref:Uncharacterized protein n=1 Tax=Glycine max TaxID=3847 RepID=K7KV09_SOYBN
MSDAQERFRNIRLREEYDMHDRKDPLSVVLLFLRKRSKIIEILAAQEIVLALDNRTNQRICFLNVSPDEVIRSMFHNENNVSFIIVSVYASDGYSSLKCRSTSIEYIRRGKLDPGFAIFESESLKWPGFVEFNDINGKTLTYSAQDSPGIMLIFAKASSHVPLKILSIEDGTVLKSFNLLLHENKKERTFELTEVSRTGSINVSNILTGKCLAKIKASDGFPGDALFCDEERNEVYTVNRNGLVHVWSKCTPNKRQKI